MIPKALLHAALEQAVITHFCHLFDVLLRDPSPEALKRFTNGIDKLDQVTEAVETTIGSA